MPQPRRKSEVAAKFIKNLRMREHPAHLWKYIWERSYRDGITKEQCFCLSCFSPCHPFKRLAMELFLSLDDGEHLAGREHLAKFQMIFLLDLLHLHLYLVSLLDGLEACRIIAGVGMSIKSHLTEQRALLVLHLPEQREKA